MRASSWASTPSSRATRCSPSPSARPPAATRSCGSSTWSPPPAYGYSAVLDPSLGSGLGRQATEGLAEMVRPWRHKFPAVRVTERAVAGPAAAELVDASRSAGLLVVGRRSRRSPVGPHLGHVAHAVIPSQPGPGRRRALRTSRHARSRSDRITRSRSYRITRAPPGRRPR
ncbi:universal stress protein [Streptomyces microflavus]